MAQPQYMISAVVILYHPDPSINNNLRPILSQTQRLYVVDNTEQSQIGLLEPEIASHPKLIYRHTGKNEGIAHPLNVVCRSAIGEGYLFLLTMDQDSHFEVDVLKKYISSVLAFSESTTVGMFGVSHITAMISGQQNPEYDFAPRLITSGSIINLQKFEQVGDFDEQLFIDHVDSEYCFRIVKAGLRNVLFKNIFLQHHLGIVSEHFSLKNGKTSSRTLHAPVRVYYMVRNFLYLSRHYRRLFPNEIGVIKKDTLNRIKNNFLYGAARWKVVRYVARAIIDFRKGKMGKIGM